MDNSLINISAPMDPITAIAQAVSQWGRTAEEYARFLQTEAGQAIAKDQLKDWVATKAAAASVGAMIEKALDGAIAHIAKAK